jgi:serine/threonine protein kinase
MEYLEGQSLADRLKKGTLPLEQALQYGIELADALSAAHRQGVIHRDVKPGNVMLVKTGVKLLDFGLAKVSFGTTRRVGDPVTAAGTILGTLQYMGPEQLEGGEASVRTDIFAFGAVLYEMVTGRPAFEGKSQASLIASIMTSVPPPVSTVRPVVPESLDHVIQRCLAKDPEERWQSGYDLKRELQWIAGNVSKPSSSSVNHITTPSDRRAFIGAAIGAAAGLAAGAGITILRSPSISLTERGKHRLLLPEETLLAAVGKYLGPAISPDGSRIVLAATRNGQTELYWKRWSSPDWNRIPGTQGGHSPFWKPNSQEIGFFADGYLKTANLFSGEPVKLCKVSQPLDNQGKGGAWNDSDDIIFAGFGAEPIFHVRVSDPVKKELTTVDDKERRHCWPTFLPDQRHFLYLGYTRDPDRGVVYVGSLDSPVLKKPVLNDQDSGVTYAAKHILYVKPDLHRRLYARKFNTATLETEGEGFVVDNGPVMVTEFRACFSATDNGRLVYYDYDQCQLVCFHRDRSGAKEVVSEREDRFKSLRLSSDGQKLFYSLVADWGDPTDRKIHILNLKSRLTSSYNGKGTLRSFVFSNDSRQAFFSGGLGPERQANRRMVFRTTLTSDNKVDDLLAAGQELTALDVSYNDKFLLLLTREPRTNQKQHLWYSELSEGDGKVTAGDARPFDVEPGFSAREGRFSPRGLKNLWVAYVSDQSGAEEVYIRPFPTGEKKQISTAGGNWPVWTKGGKEIVYLSPDNVLTAISLKDTGSGLEVTGTERLPFSVPDWSTGRGQRGDNVKYDITPDGNLIYAIESLRTPVYTLDNWNTKS